MISDREIEGLLDLVITKYARTQINYFYLKNGVHKWIDELDIPKMESLLKHLISQGTKVIYSNMNYFVNQSNFIDFFNTLIDSDKKEEFRTHCLNNETLIRNKFIKKFYILLTQEIKDDLLDMAVAVENDSEVELKNTNEDAGASIAGGSVGDLGALPTVGVKKTKKNKRK